MCCFKYSVTNFEFRYLEMVFCWEKDGNTLVKEEDKFTWWSYNNTISQNSELASLLKERNQAQLFAKRALIKNNSKGKIVNFVF